MDDCFLSGFVARCFFDLYVLRWSDFGRRVWHPHLLAEAKFSFLSSYRLSLPANLLLLWLIVIVYERRVETCVHEIGCE